MENSAKPRVASEATAIGERCGDPDLIVLARNLEGRALLRQNQVAPGLSLLDEVMVEVTRGACNPLVIGIVYCNVITTCQQMGLLTRTGGLGLPAARLGATVVATDWSPQMIAAFEARVRQEGLSGTEGRVMDCHALEFADNSFDITGSQFGVMLVPDQQRALCEMVRVTKPGGRVLLIAYGNPAQFEALHLFIGALRSVVPDFEGLPESPPPLEFQVSDPKVLRFRLEQAGLTDVTVDTAHEERVELRSGQQLWDWCLGGNPIPRTLVADLSDDQKAAVKRSLDAMIHERKDDAGVAIVTAPLNIGIGIK